MLGYCSLKLFTDALDVREVDSSDWFRFFFSWLVVVFVLLFKMPLSSFNLFLFYTSFRIFMVAMLC